MIERLRQRLLALQKTPGIEDGPDTLPLGIPAIDTTLGGGLMRSALHEIAAQGEAHLAAAAGFALGLATLSGAAHADRTPSPLRGEGWGEGVPTSPSSAPPHPTSLRSVHLSPQGRGERRRGLFWIAEDMALAENGAPHGAGLDVFGLAPERLVTISAAHRRDLLWAMEEALRCRAMAAVIGEMRDGVIDGVAVRRLSLAAAESGALALLLRAAPPQDASTAATRWIVGAAPSSVIPGREQSERVRPEARHRAGPSGPDPLGPSRNDEEIKTRCFAQLVRNRRGPVGSWILEWSNSDERFILATHTQPVAAPSLDRPHRQVA